MIELLLVAAVVLLGLAVRRQSRRIAALEAAVAALRGAAAEAEEPTAAGPGAAGAPGRPGGPGPRGADAVSPAATGAAPPDGALPAAKAPGAAPVGAPAEPPAAAPAGPPAEPPAALPPSAPIVLRSDRIADLGRWLAGHWVYAVSAVSLALAGVFLVQYGIEQGLIAPPVRVLGAIALGLALIGAGERIRRRSGDAAGPAALLPSTFSGAGVVSILAGIVAARLLYGLIGPGTALAGQAAVAAGAVVLGWRHGPFLSAVGLVGGAAAPFLVGGAAERAGWLYGYFPILSALGLAIDAFRRWAWVSALALAAGLGGLALLHLGLGMAGPLAGALFALAVIAVLVPARGILPDHPAPTLGAALLGRGAGPWPTFSTRLAAGAVAAASAGLALVLTATPAESLLAFGFFAALGVLLAGWSGRAPGLADLWLLPAAAFLWRLWSESTGTLGADFFLRGLVHRVPESAPPLTLSLVLALGLALAAAAGLRALGAGAGGRLWAVAAAAFPPLALALAELVWSAWPFVWAGATGRPEPDLMARVQAVSGPASVLGPGLWAFHAMAAAVAMTAFAVALGRRDGADRSRAALATLSALVLIAFGLFVVLSEAALSVAFAIQMALAAWLDRRFRLPEVGWFVIAGMLALLWRAVAAPGLPWAMEAALPDVLLALGGGAAGGIAAARLLPRAGRSRVLARGAAEAGAVIHLALLADVLLWRWLDGALPDWRGEGWGAALSALPWIAAAVWHLRRAGEGLPVGLARAAAVLVAIPALGGLALAATVMNPLVSGRPVRGAQPFDTVTLAFLLPAAVLLAGARALPRGARPRRWLTAAAAVFAAFWTGLEIRLFWRGADLSAAGTTQAELYSYTVAMILGAAALLWQAIASGSPGLRRAAMTVIACTIAKVFLIDAAGLTGLTRVLSFLGLGLALAGVAWLNRWAAGRQARAVGPGSGRGEG